MNHPSRFARGLALSVFIAAGLTAAYWGHGRSGRSGVDTAPADRPTSTAAVARGPPILALSDVMRTSGFEFTYDNGRAAGRHVILECLGGGVGTFDYDGDGRWDLFCPGGGQYRPHGEITGLRSALFRNLGDWKFEPVTAPSGAARAPYYTHGCCAGDFNSDGFTDVLVTGYGGLQLFQNQGDGRFIEVREQAGLFDDSWITSAAWGDLNGDGHPDLYLAHYVDWLPAEGRDARDFGQGHAEVCLPRRFNPLPDAVYYSNGDGTFRDATSAAGFVVEPSICGKGLGVVLGDVDLDGDVDVYVANDTDPNFLYLNQGSGVFQEVGLLHGAACDAIGKPTGSMGVDLGDYDGDGLPDIFVSNFENETFSLYRNEGAAHFLHVSQATGIMALGRLYVGWGTLFADVDRDGDEDLVVSNGHVFDFSGLAPNKQEPLLLMNERGQFVKAAFPPGGYFSTAHRGRGLAVSDLDDDGDLDFVFSHVDGEPNALLSNEIDNENGWLRVRLVGTSSNRDAIGAWLVLHTSDGNQLRLVKGGASYLSQSDLRPFWGIPSGVEIKGLTIHWPRGQVQAVSAVATNQTLVFIEPPPSSAYSISQ